MIATGPGPSRAYIAGAGSSATTTSALVETNLQSVRLPPLGPNDRVRVTGHYKASGAGGVKKVRIRHSTAQGDTAAGTLLVTFDGAAGTASGILAERGFANVGATNVQACADSAIIGVGGATNAAVAGAIDTSVATWINFNAFLANGADTLGYIFWTVEVIPAT